MNAASISLLALLIQQSISIEEVRRGEVADHRFEAPPLNALGVESLSDLRGKPVLVAYWGHTTWADDWVDDALAWQRQFGTTSRW